MKQEAITLKTIEMMSPVLAKIITMIITLVDAVLLGKRKGKLIA